MSTVYIPLPDYDVPQINTEKYIPSPDYGTVNSTESALTELPTDYLPKSVASVRTKKTSPSYSLENSDISSSSNSSRSQPADFMIEPEYIESTKSHIKSIGVSVLSPSLFPHNVALQYNKAFNHHMENHRKFDTIKSRRTYEECHICQIIGKGEEMTDAPELLPNRRRLFSPSIVEEEIDDQHKTTLYRKLGDTGFPK